MPTLEIKNISKTYKKGTVKALDDFSVTLTSGVYGLLGPNGAGKSTLMNIITDNLNSDSGEVLYDCENIKKLGKDYRTVLGYMPQQQGLYDNFTLNRFLWYMAALKGLKKKEAKAKITSLLETVNLKGAAHKKLGAFSGGMKQRALIAQALLNDPKTLILDEPTAGLDPKERIRIRNFISEIAENKIVLISTHVVSDIEFIAKEIILLKSGKLVSHDTCNNLIKEIENKVFEVEINKEELKSFQNNYRVSNLFHNDDKIIVRTVTDNPPENYKVQPVKPTLEDLYLYVFETGK
ncbi:ABC transporter ATP-binding protein [uncultured Ruminococcus sp.]|uniref:ABC transporter ATP-binding protein n=1 Tax=uncultured Ruminococcus sp. TaxID=165186 RepID=UPI0025DF3D20|nr:ABC transporter ATP-binding protein [uncultured Ruminococcus sp.]